MNPGIAPNGKSIAAAILFLWASPALARKPLPADADVLLAPLKPTGISGAEGAIFSALVAEQLGKVPHVSLSMIDDASLNLSDRQKGQAIEGAASAAAVASQAGKRFLVGGKVKAVGGFSLLQLFVMDSDDGSILARESARIHAAPEKLAAIAPALATRLAAHLHPTPEVDKPKNLAAVVDRNSGFVQHCYEEQWEKDATLAGTVVLKFRVTPDNRVDGVSVDHKASQLKSAALFQCIEASAKSWRFSRTPLTEAIQDGATLPFVPSPVESGSGGPAPKYGSPLLPRSPFAEGSLKSLASATHAVLKFVNETSSPVQIHWLNYRGKRRSYGVVPAHGERVLQTYVSHPWVVTTPSGRGVEIFVANSEASTAIIESPIRARPAAVEKSIRSRNSKVPAALRFVNRTSNPVRLFWIDYAGKRQLRDNVAPHAQKVIRTFATHPWLVTDADQKALAVYVPRQAGHSTAIIEGR